jgi:hypothetical protein
MDRTELEKRRHQFVAAVIGLTENEIVQLMRTRLVFIDGKVAASQVDDDTP